MKIHFTRRSKSLKIIHRENDPIEILDLTEHLTFGQYHNWPWRTVLCAREVPHTNCVNYVVRCTPAELKQVVKTPIEDEIGKRLILQPSSWAHALATGMVMEETAKQPEGRPHTENRASR
jgi:hypothetical protein